MSKPFKPKGYNSVSPYLIVRNAEASLSFLTKVLQAQELRRFSDETGRILHVEVQIDDSVVMMAESMEGWPSSDSHVHIYVPDVDDSYQKAMAAGGESVQEPMKKDDPDRRCGVKDAGGTTWWISTMIEH